MSFRLGRSKPLERRTPLRQTTPLRRSRLSRSRPARRVETPAEREARLAWSEPKAGWCKCGGCGDPGRYELYLENHHVVTRSKLKQIGREDVLFDQRNSMRLAKHCHELHTGHARKIRIEVVPVAAVAFAVEVLGEGGAWAYFQAHYDCTVTL